MKFINTLYACLFRIKLLVALSCLLLNGCIPEPLEVKNVPTVKPEIVVNTQFLPDETVVVLLTKTFGALDASGDSDPEALLRQIAVADAEVTIQGPQGTYTLTNLDLGLYGGILIPFEAGQEYTLNVFSPTLGSVQATTKVKEKVNFQSVNAELYYNGFGDTLAQISYSVIDPAGQNWYMINVQEAEREDVLNNILNPRAYTVLIEDAAVSEQTFSDVFRVFPRDYAPGDTIAVSLANISKEYYQFMEMRQDNRFSFTDFFGEPVNYSSNVIGGKGFFNLYVPDVHIFIFEEDTDTSGE